MRRLLVIVASVATILICATVVSSRPWVSTRDVHEFVAEKLPPGASVDEVLQFVHSHGWQIISDFRGNTSGRPDHSFTGVAGFRVIGAKLPSYGFPFKIHTEVYWGFDANDRIVDVNVRRWSAAM